MLNGEASGWREVISVTAEGLVLEPVLFNISPIILAHKWL